MAGGLIDLAPRVPRAATWEGWFCIAIGDRGSEVRWTKTHLFRSVRRPGHHPIAALEGLRESPGEVVTWIATAERVEERRLALDADAAATCVREPFGLSVGQALQLTGESPDWRFAAGAPDGGEPAITLDLHGVDRVEWVRLPRLLSYAGAHCAARGRVRAAPFSGLGVLEHAWGASLPFDPTRLVRGRWHWDVLHLQDDGAVAAMWLPFPFLGRHGVRGAGRLPGEPFGAFRPRSVEYLERDGDVPRRWHGRLEEIRTGREISYEAVATTPPAVAAPGVFFLGLDVELRAGARRLEGRGFCECGGPGAAV